MINLTKITNKDSSFLISYWAQSGQQTWLVTEDNIIAELNKAFKAIEDENKRQRELQQAAINYLPGVGTLAQSALPSEVHAA